VVRAAGVAPAGAVLLHVGQAVLGLAPGCLGTHVRAPAATVAAKPPAVAFEQAAGAVTIYVTVDLALRQAAGVGGACSLLIHGAAGGVGLAAADVARGACVAALGTAGAQAKRALLRRAGMRALANSRGTVFAETVAQASAGGGVGVVLNSLTSAGMVAASLACLGAGGCVVELAKRDIWGAARAAQERRGVSFSLVALDFLPPAAAGRACAGWRPAWQPARWRPRRWRRTAWAAPRRRCGSCPRRGTRARS